MLSVKRLHVAIGSAVLLAGVVASYGDGAPTVVPVTANVGGPPADAIGEITVQTNNGPGESGKIEADFVFAEGFGFLDEWYNFRWLNIEYALILANGANHDANTDGTPDDPLLGDLPAVDPPPEGFQQGDDDKPFYETDEEFEEYHSEGEWSHWHDGRSSGMFPGATLKFRTYLVVESKTDPAIPPKTMCVLAGFQWKSEIPAGGGPGVETVTSSIPGIAPMDVAEVNTALGNAQGPGFPGWQATHNCTLTACINFYCPWDCYPIAGNNVVDIDDLLALLNHWGGSHPSFDFVPPGGDGFAGVDELLAIISGWGNCPVVTGGCCLPQSHCVIETELICLELTGVYQGDGTSCQDVQCPSPPPNDLCWNAVYAVNGASWWDNTDANTDGPAACADMTRDVWLDYTATCTGLLTIDTLGTPQPFVDTMLQVFNGTSCNPLGQQLACNDDIDNPGGNLLSSVTISVIAGQAIKIRCGSWGSIPTNQGQAMLNIGCTPADNDYCTQATPISVGGAIADSLIGATQDNAPWCQGVSPASGRWYTVVGNGSVLTASTCASPDGYILPIAISVYAGSCDNLVCVAASDSDTCNLLHESVSWYAQSGQTYRILVHGWIADPSGWNEYLLTVN